MTTRRPCDDAVQGHVVSGRATLFAAVASLLIGIVPLTMVLAQNPTPAGPKPTGDLTESVLGRGFASKMARLSSRKSSAGGLADKAGIRPGDQLASIEKHNLASMKDVLNVLACAAGAWPGHQRRAESRAAPVVLRRRSRRAREGYCDRRYARCFAERFTFGRACGAGFHGRAGRGRGHSIWRRYCFCRRS